MRINTARQAWFDAYYQPSNSVTAKGLELARLGRLIQSSQRTRGSEVQAHHAIAAHIQCAIDTLPGPISNFGHWMYNPQGDTDNRKEDAAILIYLLAVMRSKRMTKAKRQKAEWVALGVMVRYRHMHQGGQNSASDPLAKPETFRAWLFEKHGVRLNSEAWQRDWVPFIDTCFDVCDEIDQQALEPVAKCLNLMRQVA